MPDDRRESTPRTWTASINCRPRCRSTSPKAAGFTGSGVVTRALNDVYGFSPGTITTDYVPAPGCSRRRLTLPTKRPPSAATPDGPDESKEVFPDGRQVLGHLSDRHAGNRDRLFEAIRFIKFGDHPGIYAVVITPIEAQRYASVYTDFAR